MPSYPLPRTTLALTASLSAVLALSACGGGSSSSSRPSASNATSAAVNKTAPTLKSGDLPLAVDLSDTTKAAPAPFVSATVPAPMGSLFSLITTKPLTGTLPINTTDGKPRTSADGDTLVGYGWKENSGGITGYTKTVTVTLLVDGKPLVSHTITTSDDQNHALNAGGAWVAAVPDSAKTITERMTFDNGQQVVPAGSTKRDDAVSNGIDPTTKLNVPIAAPNATCTGTNNTSCGLTAAWDDDDDSRGWAPPGKTWLTLQGNINQSSTSQNAFGQNQTSTQSVGAVTVKDAKLGTISPTPGPGTGDNSFSETFLVPAGSPNTNFSMDASWLDNGVGNSSPGNAHLTSHATAAYPLAYEGNPGN